MYSDVWVRPFVVDIQMIAADIFKAFEEAGLENTDVSAVGQRLAYVMFYSLELTCLVSELIAPTTEEFLSLLCLYTKLLCIASDHTDKQEDGKQNYQFKKPRNISKHNSQDCALDIQNNKTPLYLKVSCILEGI